MNDELEKIYTIDEIKSILKKYIQENKELYKINKVVLFGSYARGEADKFSDIDLIILDSPDFYGMRSICFYSELKEIFKKDVDSFIEKSVDKTSRFYQNILKEGVIVYE